MLVKLRKGAAASLNATRLVQVFEALGSGWKIEQTQFYKLSEGGWLLKQIDNGNAVAYAVSWARNTDNRVHCEANEPRDVGEYAAWNDSTGEEQRRAREQDARNYAGLQRLAKVLERLQTAPGNGKWFVRNVTAETVPARCGNGRMLDVSFEFHVRTNGFIVTSPDGQTYEVVLPGGPRLGRSKAT